MNLQEILADTQFKFFDSINYISEDLEKRLPSFTDFFNPDDGIEEFFESESLITKFREKLDEGDKLSYFEKLQIEFTLSNFLFQFKHPSDDIPPVTFGMLNELNANLLNRYFRYSPYDITIILNILSPRKVE